MSADGSFCRPEGTLSLMLEPSEIFLFSIGSFQFVFDNIVVVIVVVVVVVVDIVDDVGSK